MTTLLADRFRRLFEYEMDSHARVVAAFETVPAGRRSAPELQEAIDLLAHVISARRMWLARLGLGGPPEEGFFPKGVRLQDLPARLEGMHAPWRDYLASCDDAEVQRTFEYTSSDAGLFRNTIDEILTQLHGHSLYHRGQIASRVRTLGGEPAITDYIYWSRRKPD